MLVATGVHYRRLPVDGLEAFEGTSVFYAATEIEARVCVGDPVVVVGGGNSAGQAALFLADRAAHVPLLIREDDIARNMSRYLVDRIVRHPRIEVLVHTEVRELVGDGTLEGLVVEETTTGNRRRIDARARCSSSSEPNRTPAGSQTKSGSMIAASCSPGPTYGSQRLGTHASPAPPRNELPRGVRCGRCAQRLDQAGRGRGRRGINGSTPRARTPRCLRGAGREQRIADSRRLSASNSAGRSAVQRDRNVLRQISPSKLVCGFDSRHRQLKRKGSHPCAGTTPAWLRDRAVE